MAVLGCPLKHVKDLCRQEGAFRCAVWLEPATRWHPFAVGCGTNRHSDDSGDTWGPARATGTTNTSNHGRYAGTIWEFSCKLCQHLSLSSCSGGTSATAITSSRWNWADPFAESYTAPPALWRFKLQPFNGKTPLDLYLHVDIIADTNHCTEDDKACAFVVQLDGLVPNVLRELSGAILLLELFLHNLWFN